MHLQGDAPALVFRCAAAFRGLRAPRGLGFVKLSEHHAPFRMLRAGAGAINIPLQVYCACAFALGIRIRSSAWANPGGTIQGAFRVQPSNIQMKKLHDCEFWSSSGPLIRAMDCRLFVHVDLLRAGTTSPMFQVSPRAQPGMSPDGRQGHVQSGKL